MIRIKQIISIFVSVSFILTTPASLFAQNQNLNNSTQTSPESSSANQSEITPELEQKGWFPKPMETINEIFELYEFGLKNIEEKFSELEYAKWIELVDQGKVAYEHETLGKVSYTSIDGIPVIRVVHKASGTAFMLLDSTKISKNSNHLKQYVARQNMFSGMTDQQPRKGRDVVLLWFQPNISNPSETVENSINPNLDLSKVNSIDVSPKPTTRMGKIRAYWTAIYKKPTRDNVLFGVGCGVIQTLMGLAVSAVKVALDPSASFLMEPALLNFMFGTVIGAYSSTYRNWVYDTNPSMVATTLKGSTISFLYAYSLVYMTQGGFSSLSIMDAAGLLLHGKIMSNVILNNWGKQEWNQWARVKSQERADNREYQMPIPFSDTPMKVKQRDINFQLFAYLPPQFLRTADLIGITLSLPYLGFPLPLGSLALWTSIPIVKYGTLKWAEKYYPIAAKELKLRESWENFKRLPLRLPAKAYQQTLRIIKAVPSTLTHAWQVIARNTPVLNKMVVVDSSIDAQTEQTWAEMWAKLKPSDFEHRESTQKNLVQQSSLKKDLNSKQEVFFPVCHKIFAY